MVQHDGIADLYLDLAPELATGSAAADRELLLGRLKSISFAYLDKKADWQEQWRDREELPHLVKIRADFAESDTRLWPELTIAPRIDVGVSCVLDPLNWPRLMLRSSE